MCTRTVQGGGGVRPQELKRGNESSGWTSVGTGNSFQNLGFGSQENITQMWTCLPHQRFHSTWLPCGVTVKSASPVLTGTGPLAPSTYWMVLLKSLIISPGWCGSVDWAPAYEPKGRQFDSQSGHMPGLQDRFPVGGVWEATIHWCFSPSFSLPPHL